MTPLLVPFYAGPGVGKSTTVAGVFHDLKVRGVNVELVHEVAKDFVWEHRTVALGHQPYIIAKQMFHWDRLGDQVDVVLTDTSTLYGLIYGENLLPEFREWVVADYHARDTLNIYLKRNPSRAYNPAGRLQDQAGALAADAQIRNMLWANRVQFTEVDAARPNTVQTCFELIWDRLS